MNTYAVIKISTNVSATPEQYNEMVSAAFMNDPYICNGLDAVWEYCGGKLKRFTSGYCGKLKRFTGGYYGTIGEYEYRAMLVTPQMMQDIRKRKADRLAKCFGAKSGEITHRPCTGKWRGTTDYSITFDNGERVFISNGLRYFDKILNAKLAVYEAFNNPERKAKIVEALRKMETEDAKIAKEVGLESYHLIDIKCTMTGEYIGWFYGVLEINGEISTINESNLNSNIYNSLLKNDDYYVSSYLNDVYFVAAGIEKPDYVFHNVGFDTKSPMYKHHEGEKRTKLYKCANI